MTTSRDPAKRGTRSDEGWRLTRVLVLLAVCVLGARYVLGLPTLVAVFGGATVAYVLAVALNRVFSS
jgi:uncharacterized oligopeptide transporter (OPT) family protein